MRKVVAGTVLALFTAGCMIGPDYRRPALDMPQSFMYEPKEALEAADTEWWRCFRDPVLDQLILEALANNKSVKITATNIEQAAGFLEQTRSALFPQVNYTGAYARQRLSEKTASPGAGAGHNPFNDLQLLAGVSWELDLWGRVRRLTEAARAQLLASEEARRGAILTLVSSVAGTYMQLRGLDDQLIVARRSLATYRQSVELYELQFQYGLISMMVVEQARTQYETAATTIPQLESEIVQTENALSVLLGRNPGPIARGKAIDQLAFPAIPAGLPSQLLVRRPDVAQAELNLIAANARIGAAKALYFPTISLTGAFGFESQYLSNLFSGPARAWNFAGSAIGPIFTAGGISGQVRQSEGAEQSALTSYLAAVQSAFADVENALIVRQKLTEQIAAQERLVVANREYERLAKLLYDEGYAPYLTVLNAQQQLFPSELNLVQLRASLFTAYANLYKAMGGGWVTEAERYTSGEPTGTQQAATQPICTQPGCPPPAGAQPAGAQPAGAQPAGAQPAGGLPAGGLPMGTQPPAGQGK